MTSEPLHHQITLLRCILPCIRRLTRLEREIHEESNRTGEGWDSVAVRHGVSTVEVMSLLCSFIRDLDSLESTMALDVKMGPCPKEYRAQLDLLRQILGKEPHA